MIVKVNVCVVHMQGLQYGLEVQKARSKHRKHVSGALTLLKRLASFLLMYIALYYFIFPNSYFPSELSKIVASDHWAPLMLSGNAKLPLVFPTLSTAVRQCRSVRRQHESSFSAAG